jgi:hypothetical protein
MRTIQGVPQPDGGGVIPESPDAPVTPQGNSKAIIIVDANGSAVLIPTTAPSGETLGREAAIEMFKATGKHLGKFRSEKEAAAHLQSLR